MGYTVNEANLGNQVIGLGGPVQQPQQEQPKQPSIYGKVPAIPVLEAVEGIRFDFNDGIRVMVPQSCRRVRVTFLDMDTGVILYSSDVDPGAMVTSVKKFYIRFKLVISDPETKAELFTHEYDAADRDVLIQLPVGTLGDTIGWFSYVERFQRRHRCKLHVCMMRTVADIVRNQYPDIDFIEQPQTEALNPYATYYMGLFFRGDVDHQPIDFRYIGLHRTAGYILGLKDADLDDVPPRFDLSAERIIKDKYVCIATQSSSQAKYWNNPFGWHGVIKFLKDSGYRVLCIDREQAHGDKLVWNHIPNGAEDFTGDLPLQERINLIKDADMFIGLSSGLSWLAWGCGVPVVMISGFTHPTNEFHTPYRIINYHTCHSCWNDMRENFDHYDFLWCPRHKGDERQFECTRLISSEQVINTIRSVPTFRA